MPSFVDRCGSCHRPLYAEEGISGGCDCPDRDLRILLARQRVANTSKAPSDFASSFMASEAQQPPLDMTLLMSEAGRNELRYAQQLAGFPRIPPQIRQAQTTPENDDVSFEPTAFEDDIDLGGGDVDWTGSWDQTSRHNARTASAARSMDAVDLSAMWMQGSDVPYTPDQLIAPEALDDFDFNTRDLVVDAPSRQGGGASSGRFRVDGTPPPRIPFNGGLVGQGPMVESSRVRNGRFPVLREQGARPPPPPRTDFLDQMRAELDTPWPRQGGSPIPRQSEAPRPPPVRSALEQARALQQSKPTGTSVYDLIRKNPLGK
jgi:hypothetical protein